jgi:hypothetical protein
LPPRGPVPSTSDRCKIIINEAKPFILNHNLHRVHHRHPLASWASLPGLFAADRDSFAGPLFGTVLKQLKGPMRRPSGASTEAEIRQAAE